MNNKRQFTRLPFDATATVNIDDMTYKTQVHDISLNGIHFSDLDEVQLKVGTHVSLNVQLNEKAVSMLAHLVRKTPVGYAGTIESIDPESFHYLKRLLIINFGSTELVNSEIESLLKN